MVEAEFEASDMTLRVSVHPATPGRGGTLSPRHASVSLNAGNGSMNRWVRRKGLQSWHRAGRH